MRLAWIDKLDKPNRRVTRVDRPAVKVDLSNRGYRAPGTDGLSPLDPDKLVEDDEDPDIDTRCRLSPNTNFLPSPAVAPSHLIAQPQCGGAT
jgi:hypothetical protein